MNRHFCLLVLLVALLGVSFSDVSATSLPNRIIEVRQLSDLLRTSQVIAQVRITAGEGGERYEPVYRARVEESFKGSAPGAILHLGSTSMNIGQVYLVFLQRAGTVGDRLEERELSRSFPAEAPYYAIETGLADHFKLMVTQAFGAVDVAASFAREYVKLPRTLRQVANRCPEEPTTGLVLRDPLYAWMRDRLRSNPNE